MSSLSRHATNVWQYCTRFTKVVFTWCWDACLQYLHWRACGLFYSFLKCGSVSEHSLHGEDIKVFYSPHIAQHFQTWLTCLSQSRDAARRRNSNLQINIFPWSCCDEGAAAGRQQQDLTFFVGILLICSLKLLLLRVGAAAMVFATNLIMEAVISRHILIHFISTAPHHCGCALPAIYFRCRNAILNMSWTICPLVWNTEHALCGRRKPRWSPNKFNVA